ncbi:hypothetical protein GCM10010981_19830 [Dyella nitratireducens]|uniref:Uncharacterized protein n=1 Tax=Dyella nitratireducens TaxID=1849580 RepID=A0ABQ1FU46_9GAMM|nr:hypothetical protein GCM10010981_19830 [Dyella nitratireducens]GLQ42954.1 hypothetical protein GCM10007902_28040 [Dyella nitratireducens]
MRQQEGGLEDRCLTRSVCANQDVKPRRQLQIQIANAPQFLQMQTLKSHEPLSSQTKTPELKAPAS